MTLKRIGVAIVLGLAVAVFAAGTRAADGPSGSLSRTSGGMQLTLHWGRGIDAVFVYLVRHNHQQIYNLPPDCTPSHYSAQKDQIQCVIKKSRQVTLRFSVKPRYPGHETNHVQLDSGGSTTRITVIGP